MREAVIVSTARTPIGKAYRGAFNDTPAQTLGGHAIEAALGRAGIPGGEVDDVIMGAALQQGTTGFNVARQCALRAGLPTSVAGMSVDRQCASGLMAISIAAKEIIVGRHEHHCRRRPRVDLAGAERPHEPLPRDRPMARGASRRALHVDAGDRRNRRGALRHLARGAGRLFAAIAAAHRRRAGGGTLRCGNRTAPERHESRGQDDRRDQRQGSQAQAGRRQSRRHDARRSRRAEAGVRGRPTAERRRLASSPPATLRNCRTAPAPAY